MTKPKPFDFVDADKFRYPAGNPAQQREADLQRRAAAQARKLLIAKWDSNIPTGYIHVDDAIEYMRRRWGKAIRAAMFEAFSRDESGPAWTIFGDFPDPNRGQRYYKFDDIDMWVYRTFTGVPAGWKETRHLKSSVPVIPLESLPPAERRRARLMLEGIDDGEKSSDGGTGIEEDGRGRN